MRFIIPLRCILNDVMVREVCFGLRLRRAWSRPGESAGLQIQRNLAAGGMGTCTRENPRACSIKEVEVA
ncbi:MAG: hypothetical protein LC670_07035 [Flavobacteriales bacterium]|nr:hypothetical protein [Flavobacteriales bacterium]